MAWNKPVAAPKPKPEKPSAMRGIVAGLVVVALAAACVVFFMGKGEKTVEKVEKKPTRIKEVAPAPAPTNAVPAKPIDPREDYDHEECYRDEAGVLRYKKSGCRAYDKTVPAHPINFLNKRVRTIFDHYSENELSIILEMEPGERRLDEPDYDDPDFLKDFEQSLKEPTLVKDDDIEYDKQLKMAVADVKKELAERIKKGEKLSDILKDVSREYERLAEYKEKLVAQVESLIEADDANFSDSDIKDLVGAANKMLEEQGLNPIKADGFVRWNVRLMTKRMKASKAKE